MKDVGFIVKENMCIFCLKHKCRNCMNIQIIKDKNLTTYKCLNFKKGKSMEQFKEYINYAFYDETGNYIAIVFEGTPEDVVKELQKEYDEVKYSEK